MPHIELRGGLGGVFIVGLLKGDVLYTDSVPNLPVRYFAGAGLDIFYSLIDSGSFEDPSPIDFALHATAGIEYQGSDLIGVFVEAQPFILFDREILFGDEVGPGLRFQAGINFHF